MSPWKVSDRGAEGTGRASWRTAVSWGARILGAPAALLVLTGIEACEPEDVDNDGWSTEEGDCDDADPTTYPGAPETCDGVDHNCDGQISGQIGDRSECPGDSCADILAQRPDAVDGTYWIDAFDSTTAFTAYCDQTRDGGGWTLVQVGAGNGSADLRDDGAVGTLSAPTQEVSAKLARTTLSNLWLLGDEKIRYGHPDYGWIYLVDIAWDYVVYGYGTSGYGVPVYPYTAALTNGGQTYPGSRFSWPTAGVPQSCPNSDGSASECGAGLHLGTWAGSYPDGVYMNYSTTLGGSYANIRYQIWIK